MIKYSIFMKRLWRWTLKKKWVVLCGSLALLVLSFVWALSRGFSFMPSVDSAQISLELQMPEDATLEQTAQVSDDIIERVSAMDEVETVGAMLSSGTSSMLGIGTGSEDVTNVSMVYSAAGRCIRFCQRTVPVGLQMPAPIWRAK